MPSHAVRQGMVKYMPRECATRALHRLEPPRDRWPSSPSVRKSLADFLLSFSLFLNLTTIQRSHALSICWLCSCQSGQIFSRPGSEYFQQALGVGQ
jgi:hypothetical protein